MPTNHTDTIDLHFPPGPISNGADGGGVGDVEGGAREDLRGPRLAWIHSWQLGWRRVQPDRALQVTPLFILHQDFFCSHPFQELFL